MMVPTPSHPGNPWGNALSDSEKAEALADNLETQFQPVADPSFPVVIEMVDVAMTSYFEAPGRETNLTNSDEVHEPSGVSVSARLLAQRVYRTEP